MTTAIPLPQDKIAAFCARWGIERLEVFGSILEQDFGANSDVDFLASWRRDAPLSLYDLVRAERELSELIGRKADLLERRSIEESPNWLLRRSILRRTEPVYVASR